MDGDVLYFLYFKIGKYAKILLINNIKLYDIKIWGKSVVLKFVYFYFSLIFDRWIYLERVFCI